MKCSLIIILLTSFQSIAFKGTAQDLISMRVNNKSFSQVLKTIEAKYSYRFVYSDSVALSRYRVSLDVKDASIEKVMSQLLDNTGFTYKKVNKNLVAITPGSALNKIQYEVRGKVIDSTGTPVAGASVVEKGTSNGTTTRTDGSFILNVANKSSILVISMVGYNEREIAITSNDLGPVLLVAATQQMEDVIVIGYGTTTRRDVTGAVDQIKASQFEDRPVGNVTQALQGAAPSLVIQQRSMNPNGNDMNINVRGISTMNNNAPLIVIDGLITDGASLNQLNPTDIQSVSVLKDAGTSAIYGSRSANGVILVTTKRGNKNQKPTVSLNGQMGWQDPKILFAPVEGYQNATLKNLALTNIGSSPEFTPDQIQDLYQHRNEEEWNFYQILQPALQQTYNLRLSGGSQNTTYMFSGGFFDQGSNFIGNYGITRYNLRSNITTEIGRLKITSILAYTRNNSSNTTAGNAIINSSRIPPYYYYHMQAENGKYLVNNALTDQNPLGELRQGGFINDKNDYINANFNAELKLFAGLKLKGVVGADVYSNTQLSRRMEFPLYASADAESPSLTMNPLRQTSDYNRKANLMNYQLMLDYSKVFGKHSVTGLLGASNESFTSRESRVTYLDTDSLLGTPTTPKLDPDRNNNYTSIDAGRTVQTSLNSVFGRFGYSFSNTYTAEINFRYDGSSKFLKQHRWGFFPSASVGWRLSNESFMAAYKQNVGDLKIRASYGVLGNQDIGNYKYMTRYELFPYTYVVGDSSMPGTGFKYGNEDLRWETTRNSNIGIDASFLHNKLTISADYFHKKIVDILVKPVIPLVFGTQLEEFNAGEMINQGWELNIGYRFNTGAFAHSVTGNIGDSRNKVTKFEGFEQINTADNIDKLTRVGVPFNAYYGLKTDGYFQSMQEIETSALPVGLSASDLKPGDVKYVDRNNDGVIDSKDRYILGYAFPRYTFGLTYNVSFKGLDFSMFWQGVGKRDMFVRGELVEPFHENYSYVIYQHQLDYWTPTNTGARWPRLTATGSPSRQNNYGRGSDLYQFDGAYARLKNIQLGYTIPNSFTQKIGIQKARLYVNAQNLITLSKESWIDPESSEFNSDMKGTANSGRNYPTLRYYGFGLDIQF
ncbi:SusC/RagA family TonB-linked outer membrane protein [Niabella sp. 22666]|uniref:SusC/RagA family TonB-linked outer membrane protein n=1 Tax=Niabella sp. 22666 TaxID=3453954 RepID=UPI003F84AAE4